MLKWNDGHAWPVSIYVGFEVKHKTNASKHMHLTSRFKLNLMRDRKLGMHFSCSSSLCTNLTQVTFNIIAHTSNTTWASFM